MHEVILHNRSVFAGIIIAVISAFSLSVLSRPGVQAQPVVQAAVTFTPMPIPTALKVGDYVEAQPPTVAADTDLQILAILDHILAALEYLTEEQYQDVHSAPSPAAGPTVAPEPPAATPAPAAMPAPVLSVWEDGSGCWTPATAQVLHLCGAAAGDGYVVRWVGVHGDSRGPEIPDADWLAVRSTGDRLVWIGHHPATHEIVTVNYWSGGHVLAVHVAGRLLFRIDRNHNVRVGG